MNKIKSTKELEKIEHDESHDDYWEDDQLEAWAEDLEEISYRW